MKERAKREREVGYETWGPAKKRQKTQNGPGRIEGGPDKESVYKEVEKDKPKEQKPRTNNENQQKLTEKPEKKPGK